MDKSMFTGYLHASLKNTLKMVVWGCTICHGVGPLVFVAGNMNRAKYIDVLGANRWAVIARYFGGELWPFQDSNASIHGSTENWKQRNEIPRFLWPPLSSDLNPTENVWYVLKNAMRKSILPHQYRSWFPVRPTVSWNSVSNVFIQPLYKSLPRRRQHVLKMKRHITRHWSDCPYAK